MISGKKEFHEEGVDRVREMGKGSAYVAHYAFFEKNHIGFVAPDIRDDMPWVDTRWLHKHFGSLRKSGFSLKSAMEDSGFKYSDNAHDAGEDAEMCAVYLKKLF